MSGPQTTATSRPLNHLPHIWLVRAYGPDRFRLLYNSAEMGAYHIRIFADVQTTLEEGWVGRVQALNAYAPAKAQAGFQTATAQGYFSNRSVFRDKREQTHIECSLELQAELPTPVGLRFMPSITVNRIAKSITRMRIREIVEGFVERSTSAFPHWLEEMQNHHTLPELLASPTVPDLDTDCAGADLDSR
jgi:hypothetical protein